MAKDEKFQFGRGGCKMDAVKDVIGYEENDLFSRDIANKLAVVLGKNVKVGKAKTVLKLSDVWKDEED